MDTNIHTEVVEQLKGRGLSQWHAIADRSGVPFSTVCKVAYGHTSNPRIKTLLRLKQALVEAVAA